MSVVGLGAFCELSANGTDDPRQQHFDVSEFAVLEGGARLVLHSDRGFTLGTNAADIWAHQTREALTLDVLCTVLPDDAEQTGDDHPWEWLAELLAERGIVVAPDDLRSLPYEVDFSEAVLERLGRAT